MIITHNDADGLICAVLLLRKFGKDKVYFSTPFLLRDTICKSIIGNKADKLWICDIAGNNQAIRAASIYEKVFWIDHHSWQPSEKPENITFVIKQAPSAAQVLADYLMLDDPLVGIANEIDTNNVKSEDAEKLRKMVAALRWKGNNLNLLLQLLLKFEINEINVFDSLIQRYESWLNEAMKHIKVHEFGKVKIVETTERIPTFEITNRMDYDILAVVYRNKTTRIELRSKSKSVLEVAKALGGGGHKLAAGATVEKINLEELARMLNAPTGI